MGIQRKAPVTGQVVKIDTLSIQPNPNQPRKYFDADELQELAISIKENGILQPLTVRLNQYGEIELISGERRLRASKLIGLEKVPCIIINMQDKNSAIFALLENIQRSNLNFFEEAEGIEKLINEFGFTQEMCSTKLGKAQSTLSNKLRLLRISPAMRRLIIENDLTERHARALLKLDSEADRQNVLDLVINEKLNVAKTEKLILEILNGAAHSRHKITVVKDVRIFINTLDNAVQMMRKSGIEANSYKSINGEFVEYTVKIPASQNFSLDK